MCRVARRKRIAKRDTSRNSRGQSIPVRGGNTLGVWRRRRVGGCYQTDLSQYRLIASLHNAARSNKKARQSVKRPSRNVIVVLHSFFFLFFLLFFFEKPIPSQRVRSLHASHYNVITLNYRIYYTDDLFEKKIRFFSFSFLLPRTHGRFITLSKGGFP